MLYVLFRRHGQADWPLKALQIMAVKTVVTIGASFIIFWSSGCGVQQVLPRAKTTSARTARPAFPAATTIPVSPPVSREIAAGIQPPAADPRVVTANDLLGLWVLPAESVAGLTTIPWTQLLIVPEFPGQIVLSRPGPQRNTLQSERVNYELHGNQLILHTALRDEIYAVKLEDNELTLATERASLTYCNLRPTPARGAHCAGWPTAVR